MNIQCVAIPAGIQTDFLKKTSSGIMPDTVVDNGVIHYPAFVTEAEDGSYEWFDVPILFKGQDMENEARFRRQCYAELRKFFYGTTEQQLELQFKGKFDEHIRAIRKAFPNPYKGEKRTVFSRFEVLKAFKTLPELYTRLVAAYTSNTEINLFWNSVNSIDIENNDCQRICSTLNIDDTLINQLIDIIDNQ